MRALQDAEIRFEFGCKLQELFVIRAVPIRSILKTVIMGCTTFGLKLRSAHARLCPFLWCRWIAQHQGYNPRVHQFTEMWTSFDRKNQKTKKLKKLKNSKQDHYVKKASIGGDMLSIGADLPSIGADLLSITAYE